MNSMVSVPVGGFHPCDRGPSSLHIEFFYTGAPFFTRSLYPKVFPIVSHWMWLVVCSVMVKYSLVYARMSYSAPQWCCCNIVLQFTNRIMRYVRYGTHSCEVRKVRHTQLWRTAQFGGSWRSFCHFSGPQMSRWLAQSLVFQSDVTLTYWQDLL